MSNEAALVPTTADPKLFADGGQMATGAKPDQQPARQSFAYVGFYGDKSKGDTLRGLINAGVEQNEFYLADTAGPYRVKPFQAYLLMFARFQTLNDGDGKLTDIILNGDKDTWDAGYRPAMLGLVAVRTGGDLTLATFSVRNAMTKAFDKLAGLTEPAGAAANRQQWAGRSAAHAKSAVLDWPQFRVCGTIWGECGDYYLSHAAVLPTPEADIPVIQKLVGEQFQSRVAPITLHFRRRVTAWVAYARLDDETKRKTNLPF